MADLTEHIEAIREEFVRSTEVDSFDQVDTRVRLIFDMFYDDDEGEPDQAIRDALTDLMHIAADRGVDMEDAVQRAAWMFSQEREEWEDRSE